MSDRDVIAAFHALKKEIVDQTAALAESLQRIETKIADAHALLSKIKFSPGGSVHVKVDQQ